MSNSDCFAAGILVMGMAAILLQATMFYDVPVNQWHCTLARVVNKTLPEVEECIKYERKEPGQ